MTPTVHIKEPIVSYLSNLLCERYMRDNERLVRREMRDRLKRLVSREGRKILRDDSNRGCLMSNTRAPGTVSLHYELTQGLLNAPG